MGQLLLQVKNVSKVFGNLNALEDLSIDIEKGSIIGLVGVTGGKTTLPDYFVVFTGQVKNIVFLKMVKKILINLEAVGILPESTDFIIV